MNAEERLGQHLAILAAVPPKEDGRWFNSQHVVNIRSPRLCGWPDLISEARRKSRVGRPALRHIGVASPTPRGGRMAAPTLTRVVRQLRAAAPPPPADETSDRELLERYLRRKDEAAFAGLVRRHERTVLAACRHVLADPADVADAFQATFLVLLQNVRRVRWHASLGGWLFAVAHRVAVSARRKTRLRTEKEGRAAARVATATALADLSWREACDVLHEELDLLRDTYRLPL